MQLIELLETIDNNSTIEIKLGKKPYMILSAKNLKQHQKDLLKLDVAKLQYSQINSNHYIVTLVEKTYYALKMKGYDIYFVGKKTSGSRVEIEFSAKEKARLFVSEERAASMMEKLDDELEIIEVDI